jgi:hypothetical protein
MTALLRVVRIDDETVTLARTSDGHESTIAWQTLCDAAAQDDAELRAVYAAALRSATARAVAESPLVVRYGHDSSGVMWAAWIETRWGGIRVGSTWRKVTVVAADEGMILPRAWMARAEAWDIATRILKIAPNHSVDVLRDGCC